MAPNAFLAEYLVRHNTRFVVPALDPEPAWRSLPDDVRLDWILVFKYWRKVAKDHTITLDGRVLQLPRGATGAANYAGKRVELHVALDGSIVAYDGERRLAVTQHRRTRSSSARATRRGWLRAWRPPRRHSPGYHHGTTPGSGSLPAAS